MSDDSAAKGCGSVDLELLSVMGEGWQMRHRWVRAVASRWMASVVQRDQFVQGFDFGEFFVWDSEHPDDEEYVLAAIDRAHAGGCSVGFEQGRGVVLAPVSHGRAAVTVEVWDGEPPLLLDEAADDLVDLDWTADGDLVLEEPTAGENRIVLVAGAYRLRIAGTGLRAGFDHYERLRREQPEDVDWGWTPASWAFRFWPRSVASPCVYRRRWTVRDAS